MLKNDQIQPKAHSNKYLIINSPYITIMSVFYPATAQDNQMNPVIIFSLQLAVRYMAVDSEHNLGITRGFNLLCENTFPATN